MEVMNLILTGKCAEWLCLVSMIGKFLFRDWSLVTATCLVSPASLKASSREECPVCSRTFGSLAALIAHSREHDPETAEDMSPCPHCRKLFSDAVLLVAHVEKEHSTSTGCVVC